MMTLTSGGRHIPDVSFLKLSLQKKVDICVNIVNISEKQQSRLNGCTLSETWTQRWESYILCVMNDMSREWDELLVKMVGIMDTNNHKHRYIETHSVC